ncbi:MAG TPA: XdhC/CoxI family protein [Bacteroidota bacterium]|nr:XdhC/CoxI family protein [Bacteroidota bacterium]
MDIFENVLDALQEENRVMLATIISTSGSTPASAFSKMLVKNNGNTWVGTVGGGCLEGDVVQAAKRLHGTNKAEVLSFHLNEDEFVQGLVCGGSLDVLVEPVTKDDIPFIESLSRRRNSGEDSVVATLLARNGEILLKQIIDSEKDIFKAATPEVEHPSMVEELHKVFHRNVTRRITVSNGELILEPIAGTPGLIIFGGGHVSRYITKAATMAGFRVTVVDDRKQYANPERFPGATQTLAVDFAEAFDHISVKSSTSIVIVTRGHQYDENILEQAVKTPARYIGMIGSKRKVLKTHEHLKQRGISPESLARVQAPMGIEIGATSAEEIGISIVAQLIAVRRGEKSPYVDKSEKIHQFLITSESIHSNQ